MATFQERRTNFATFHMKKKNVILTVKLNESCSEEWKGF